jgi:DNA primase
MRFALLPDGKDPDDLVKASGPEVFQSVLSEARPLIDLIWMRETTGVVFDAPERRAELEQRLREITSRITDESVRRHYNQDMRERLASYFGSKSAKQNQDGSNRNYQPRRAGGKAQGRMAVSDSLARSALVRGVTAQPSLREAAILVAVINHPSLAEEEFDSFSSLDLLNSELKALHKAILDCLADHAAPDRAHVLARLEHAGQTPILENVEGMVRRARMWVATDEAAIDDARQAFGQLLHLHHFSRTLHTELKAAELALASDTTEENYARMIDVQNQMRGAQSMEALIDGFGVSSGRGSANQQN